MGGRGANGFALQLQPYEVLFSDSPNLDAFSRLRISDPVGIFDSSFQWDPTADLIWELILTAGGTRTIPAGYSSAQLNVAGAGDAARLTTRQYHRYIPGKSQLVVGTGVFGAATAGVVKRFGYWSSQGDGIYLEQNGVTDVAWAVQSSIGGGRLDRVAQANWNIDPLDGTGPSGITLDLSKSYIALIDLQWLAMGRVRVGFDIDGRMVAVHAFTHANILAEPYMATADLPIMWDITSTGGADSMLCTCAAVQSEGGAEALRGYPWSAGGGVLVGAAAATPTHVMAIRPKAVFPVGGAINRVEIILEAVAAVATSNPARIEVQYNAPATGGAWVSAGPNSAVEYNITSAAAGFTAGIPIANFYIPAGGATRGAANIQAGLGRLPLTLDQAGANPRELAVIASGVGGNSNVAAAVDWRELR